MTKLEWNIFYQERHGTYHHRREVWNDNKTYLHAVSPEYFDWSEIFMNSQALKCLSSLAPLQSATCTGWANQYYIDPPVSTECSYGTKPCEKEGITPMFTTAYNQAMPKGDLTIQLAPAASASVSTKSDTAIQRDYLMDQYKTIKRSFDAWHGDISQKLRKTFNLDVNNTPKTTQELIDAIKGGKFKLDDRVMKLQAAGENYDPIDDDYVGGPLSAFEWDGPTPDKAGFDAAHETFNAMLKDTERTIIVKSPDEGLAAIQALEAWTPTGKAN